MLPLRRLLWFAAKRVAADERVQAAAARVVRDEVRPRAEEAWRRVRPRLGAARTGFRDFARDADLPTSPRDLAHRIKRRLRDKD